MTMFAPSPMTTLRDKVDPVLAAGGSVTERYMQLEQNLEAYNYRQKDWIYDLQKAVIDGESPERVRELHALTLADAVGSVQGTVASSAYGTAAHLIDQQVRNRVAAEMTKEYAKHSAAPNLKLIAGKFDKAWAEFVKLADVVDPEAQAEQIVGKDPKIQQAWMRQLEVTAELNGLLLALGSAADLAGVHGITDNDSYLGLVLAPTAVGQGRKAVWDSWQSSGRCGRWSGVLGLGETVHAITTPKEYRKYGAYQGVREQWTQNSAFSHSRSLVDAETGETIE